MEVTCSISDGSLEQGATVTVTSGLPTLMEASVARKDSFHEKWAGKSSLVVHVQCRKSYTRKTSIKADEKMVASTSTDSSTTLLPPASAFCRVSHCLFCGKNLISKSKPSEDKKRICLLADPNKVGSILSVAYSRKDSWGATVIARINAIGDVITAKVRYHPECNASFYHVQKTEPKFWTGGRPKSEGMAEWIKDIINYLESADECQHSIPDLIAKFPLSEEVTEKYAKTALKAALKNKFGQRIIFPQNTKIVCLVDSLENHFPKNWTAEINESEEARKLRIIKAAAKIIRSDIQSLTYDSENYPSAQSIENGGKETIPDSLLNFIHFVTSKESQSKNIDENPNLLRKQINICHSIISICRPRTFISPIQCALGLYAARTFGSRHLIDILNNLGTCISYHHVNSYQMSLCNEGPPIENEGVFSQFVFDNADYNIRTLSGKDTFHALGGIKCITPATEVISCPVVPEVKSGKINGSFNIPVVQYVHNSKYQGLRNITVKNVSQSLEKNMFRKTIQIHNILYFSGITISGSNPQFFTGWHGFMRQILKNKPEFETSYVMALPFINLDPTNMTTIYSALLFASKESEKVKKKCFATFDQPLFHKASIILANKTQELPNVFVRLGGFHLLMSFLGCLGKFLEGSGIEELLSVVYGSATVPHILSGHAYYRSVRAHMLIQAALLLVLTEKEPELKLKLDKLSELTQKFLEHNCSENLLLLLTSAEVDTIVTFLTEKFEKMANENRTAKLWLQEFHLVDLLFQYIFAERSGDWNLHLATVKEMLPFFHAAGHFNYAKSAHLYLQQMQELEFKLPDEEFLKFTKNGFFTVRRTDIFFSGTWTDMCIEQSLMRSMKSVGGLTHGRGFSENTIAKFISCGPRFMHIKEAFLKFSGVDSNSTKQHVELRATRRNLDLRDLNKFKTWFDGHPPFAQEENSLVCLATGLVANVQVNCDAALEVGLKLMKNMEGKKFEEIVLHRKDAVKSMAMAKNKVTINSHDLTVTAEHLFNRSVLLAKGGDLKKSFKYEMTPYPTSIFQNASLIRKGKKSDFMEVFKIGKIPPESCPETTIYVVAGGYLLYALMWPKNSTYRQILDIYVNYVLRNFGDRSFVVFDGYPEQSTTKNMEHLRRGRNSSTRINFTVDMICSITKNEFLNSTQNKKKFIAMLSEELRKHGVSVLVTESDADREIVVQAMHVSSNSRSPVTIVGTDTDLMVLLVGLTYGASGNVFFRKPGSQKSETENYSVQAITKALGDICPLIFFVYAITGCDTTSSLHGKGKMKAFHLLTTDADLRKLVTIFTEKTATKEEIKRAGEIFLFKLYGGSSVPKISTLDELRYTIYMRKMSKMSLKSRFDIGRLPPTSSAAEQHSYRVFQQAQAWQGNQLAPQDWGWFLNDQKVLQPLHATLSAVPPEVEKSIACRCKTNCTNRCSCVKNNLKCTELSHFCLGSSCSNSAAIDPEDDDIEEMIDFM